MTYVYACFEEYHEYDKLVRIFKTEDHADKWEKDYNPKNTPVLSRFVVVCELEDTYF